MTDVNDSPDPRFPFLYIGLVTKNVDPEGLGRVRVRVPGLIEPESAFAFPLGTTGGGSPQRGFFDVPDIGAEVGLFFNQGDVDYPFYLAGHWGKPNDQSEVPTEVKAVSDALKPRVKSYETSRFSLTFDDRPGFEAFRIKDKLTGDLIEFDGVEFGIQILSTSALVLRSTGAVQIEGAAVTINGRPVAASNEPI